MILDNRFNLEILHFSCISAPLETVQAELKETLVPGLGDEWEIRKYELAKNEQIDFFFNDDSNKAIKYLLWKPKSAKNEYTVFLSNFTDGWITLMNGYSKEYNKENFLCGYV